MKDCLKILVTIVVISSTAACDSKSNNKNSPSEMEWNHEMKTEEGVSVLDTKEKDKASSKTDKTIKEEPMKVSEKVDHYNINDVMLIQLIEDGINQIRIDQGLPLFTMQSDLTDAATLQNNYCNKLSTLTHDQSSSNYRTVRDRVAHFGGGYRAVGENVQYLGFMNNTMNGKVSIFPPDYKEAAAGIIKNWVDSPGHYRNIINRDYTSIGTAIAWNEELKAVFVTQVYGG